MDSDSNESQLRFEVGAGSRPSRPSRPVDDSLLLLRGELEMEVAQLLSSDRELRAQTDELERLLKAENGTKGRTRLVSRRRLLGWSGAGLAGGAVLAVAGRAASAAALPGAATAAAVPSAVTLDAAVTSQQIFVPSPTGKAATDMVNILQALSDAVAGTAVVLQSSPSAVYAINQELPIPRGVRLTGTGVTSEKSSGGGAPSMPTLRQVANTPLQAIVASAAYLGGLYGPANPGKYPQFNKLYNNGKTRRPADSAIEVDHLAFDGQNGGTGSGNTEGHGVVLYSNGSDVHDCYFLNIANAAIVAADLNSAGEPCTVQTFENRIHDNTIINPGWFGIWVTNTPRSNSCTDGCIVNNIVVSPSQQQRSAGPNLNPSSSKYYEALHLANAAGWWVAENFLQACPGDGAFFNTTWGLHLVGNTVDGFGCYPQARRSYSGFNVTTAGQLKTHPGFIIGNLAAAYEVANPFAPGMQAPATATFAYFKLSMQSTAGSRPEPSYTAYVVEADNVAHQASQMPPPIAEATIPSGNLNKVSLPQGSTGAIKVGMGITDSLGAIPAGDTVKSVTPGTGSNPDVILLTKGANKAATGDTVSFTGPITVAWTYVNELTNAGMQVNRTNETATGTIQTVPVFVLPSKPPSSGSMPTITLIDPADYAGGEYINPLNPPSAGQIIVASATAAGTAAWEAATVSGGGSAVAGGVLSGDFPNPVFSPETVTSVTESGSISLPAWATRVRITCVGAGGGGGAGSTRMGGGGGAAGTAVEQVVETGGASTIEITIGSGGAGGSGGTSTASGGSGTDGGGTEIQLGSVTITAGGGVGGAGAASGSTAAPGAAYGAVTGTTTTVASGSSGGGSGSPGGNPFFFSPGGGGGGGMAGSGLGGSGGGAGSASAGGTAGATGVGSSSAGGAGAVGTDPGAPGGGGGGSASGGTGGVGGAGADGFVVIDVVG
jgi:hypothetical protein